MSRLRDAIDVNRNTKTESGAEARAGQNGPEKKSLLRQTIDRARAGEVVGRTSGAAAPAIRQPMALPGVQSPAQTVSSRKAAEDRQGSGGGSAVTTRQPSRSGSFGGSGQRGERRAGFTGDRASGQPDWGKIAKGVVLQGADQAATGITSTLSMLEGAVMKPAGALLGNEQLYESGLFHTLNDYMQGAAEKNTERFSPEYSKAGRVGELIGEYGAATVAALPQAALAFLTAGASAAAQGTTAGLQAASQAARSAGIANTFLGALRDTAKNPQFLYSLLSTAGNEYEQAKSDGVDDGRAYAYAALTGLLNSVVEVSGGIDTLTPDNKRTLRRWVDTMLDEGKEEVIQGAISRLAQNAVYGRGNPLFSLQDENAVVSPRTAAQEFMGGAVVGGILGGGQLAVQRGLNAAYERQAARRAQEGAVGVREAGGPVTRETAQEGVRGRENAASQAETANGETSLEERFRTLLTDEGAESGQAAAGGRLLARAAAGETLSAAQEARVRSLPRGDTLLEAAGRLAARNAGQGTASVRAETEATARRLESVLGRPIRLYDGGEVQGPRAGANGYYADGIIYVNVRSQNPAAQIISHELTHSLEGTDSYGGLSRLVLEQIRRQGGDLDAVRQAKRELYEGRGAALADDAQVDAEIVAEYVEQHLLTDEESILDLVRRDRTLGERIRAFFDRVLARLGSGAARERDMLRRARDLYAKALEQTRQEGQRRQSRQDLEALRDAYARGEIDEDTFDAGLDAVMEQEGLLGEEMLDAGDHYSFGGAKANAADLDTLDRAKEMERQGVAMETIFRETGWYTGADGKWRFEIDDSGMEYSRWGDLRREDRAEFARFRELEGKFIDGSITMDEQNEMRKLLDQGNGPGRAEEQQTLRLADFLRHDELYRNYPQLRQAGLRFARLPDGARGTFDGRDITLDESLRSAPEDTLIHEIQHAIQRVEGFARGANNEFWGRQLEGGYDGRTLEQRREAQRLRQEYSAIQESEPEFFRDMLELNALAPDMPRGRVDYDTLEQIEEDPPEWQRYDAAREAMEEKYGDTRIWDFDDLLYKLKQAELSSGRTGTELYYDTAGEIEARDAARRRQLTAEERRARFPDTGNEDTVFVEETEDWMGELDAEYGPQLQGDLTEDVPDTQGAIERVASMEPVASITGEEFRKGETDLISQVEQFFNELGNRAHNPSLGEVVLDRRGVKSDIGHGIGRKKAAAFAAVPDVIARGQVVDYQKNWKGRGYDTAVIAAPIEIGGQPHIAGVVLTRSNLTNRFYLHEVLTENDGAAPFKTGARMGGPGGDTPSVISILEKIRAVKHGTDRGGQNTSTPAKDSQGRELTPAQEEYFRGSQARDSAGRLLTLYHQTADSFTVFDPRHEGAGTRDSGTPFGIFLKTSPRDIGLRGKRQMELYANITNPLRCASREALDRALRELSPEYAAIADEHASLDDEYHGKFEAAKKELRDFMTRWREENPDAGRRDLYDVPEFNHLYDAEDVVVEEWTEKAGELSRRLKEEITRVLKGAGYDGVILSADTGSFGRSTDAYIALEPEQVKNVTNQTPTADPDIRYSLDEEADFSAEDSEGREQAEAAFQAMPVKAQTYLRGVERRLVNQVGKLLSVPKRAQREFLRGIASEISGEYLRRGAVSQETADRLFERAYQEGVKADQAFAEEYDDLRRFLRDARLTIAPEDAADIPDFELWRRAHFGRLNVGTRGTANVDQIYQELAHNWSELFPGDLVHPADQLQRISDVAEDFRRVEKSLDEYYGREAETFKAWARNDFQSAIDETVGELRTVRRYAEEAESKSRERAAAQERAQASPEEAAQMWRELKNARRVYERAAAKNLLTDHDQIQVGRLLRGEIAPEHLDPRRDNVRGITAVYEAKQEYERLAGQLRQWNRARKSQILAEADRLLETANDWKDKSKGIYYSRETMERNIRDIVPDEALAEEVIRTYFTPVHQSAAEANRMKDRYREQIRKMGLSRKAAKGDAVSEAHAVQLLGEAEDNIRYLEQSRGRVKTRDGKTLEEWRAVARDLWEESPGLDQDKIRDAVVRFRSIYDDLFRQMNEVRVRNGYEPVNYRQGYFPHFQPGEGDGIMAQFGKALGIKTEVTALPTSINGLTHTFRPGIRWFGNAQERLGYNTAYDAVEGFDRYIEGVADVICQTDNIQRLRALASQARYRTGDEGIRKQVESVRQDPTLSETDKQNRIEKIYETGRFALSNFVVELDEYTNLLANKKSRADRNMEQALGRDMYNLVKGLEGRVAANMVAVNPASWLTNFIPLTQGWGTLDSRSLLGGMWDTLRAYREDDGFVGRSSFLTNRRGSAPLVQTWAQRASATLSQPMEYIDQFTADSLVRARYGQNVRRGLSEAAAMEEADAWAAGVMADRSKGSTPTLFNRSNPLTKALTQFQLEVNNQLSYLFKDLPRDTRDRGLAALAGALFKFFLGAFLYDEVYEFFIGRRPALDPIGMLNDTAGDLTGWEIPNLVELGVGAARGDAPSFQVERTGLTEAGVNLAGNVAEELPFIGGLLGGGRIPLSSAMPDIGGLWNAATNEDWSTARRLQEVRDELLEKPVTYLAVPFGGGQLKRAAEGVEAVVRGGSYSVNSDGEDILQYPVYNETVPEKVADALYSSVFGKSAFPAAREWVESGFKSLSARETDAYQEMTAAGMNGEEAFDLIRQIKGMSTAEKLSEVVAAGLEDEAAVAMAGLILGKDLTTEAGTPTRYAKVLSAVDTGLPATECLELMEQGVDLGDYLDLTEEGMEPEAARDTLLALDGLEPEAGADQISRLQQYTAIADMPLDESDKEAALWLVMSESAYGKYETARKAGISTADYVWFLNATDGLAADKDENGKTISGSKKAKVLRIINSLDLTSQQKDTLFLSAGYSEGTLGDAPWR